jgi:hypothetical protein
MSREDYRGRLPRHVHPAEGPAPQRRPAVKDRTWTGFADSEEDYADAFLGQKFQPFRPTRPIPRPRVYQGRQRVNCRPASFTCR